MTLDPITFAVVKSALDAIVDEMAYAVIRTARSEIIRDVMDYSAALCDAEGRLVAQAKTIAQHLGAVPDAMQSVRREFAGDLHPGDVVVMNDPFPPDDMPARDGRQDGRDLALVEAPPPPHAGDPSRSPAGSERSARDDRAARGKPPVPPAPARRSLPRHP
jgi:Hydantoinase B/oxoprolinase